MNLQATTSTSTSKSFSYQGADFIIQREKAKEALPQILREIDDISRKSRMYYDAGISGEYIQYSFTKSTKLFEIIDLITLIGRDDSEQYFMKSRTIRPTKENIIAYLSSEEIGFSKNNAECLFNLCLHTGYSQMGGWFNTRYTTGSADTLISYIAKKFGRKNPEPITSANDISHGKYKWLFTKLRYNSMHPNLVEVFERHYNESWDYFTNLTKMDKYAFVMDEIIKIETNTNQVVALNISRYNHEIYLAYIDGNPSKKVMKFFDYSSNSLEWKFLDQYIDFAIDMDSCSGSPHPRG